MSRPLHESDKTYWHRFVDVYDRAFADRSPVSTILEFGVFQGRSIRGVPDIAWLKPDSTQMSDEDWNAGERRSLGVFLNGHAIAVPDERGHKVEDDSFLLPFNAEDSEIEWKLPEDLGGGWSFSVDTSDDAKAGAVADGTVTVTSWSVVVLRREEPQG